MRMVYLTLILLGACGDSDEAQSVTAHVATRTLNPNPATSNLGYAVTYSTVRASLAGIDFTMGGQAHASLWQRAQAWVLPLAQAHPGHAAGGEITGELTQPTIAQWLPYANALGTATLLVGGYNGANIRFRRAEPSDNLETTDMLLGHTFYLEGSAMRDDSLFTFTAQVNLDADAQVVGAPFSLDVKSGGVYQLGLILVAQDPLESLTIFDDVDFAALANSSNHVSIVPGQPAHNVLRRSLVRHNFYRVESL